MARAIAGLRALAAVGDVAKAAWNIEVGIDRAQYWQSFGMLWIHPGAFAGKPPGAFYSVLGVLRATRGFGRGVMQKST